MLIYLLTYLLSNLVLYFSITRRMEAACSQFSQARKMHFCFLNTAMKWRWQSRTSTHVSNASAASVLASVQRQAQPPLPEWFR